MAALARIALLVLAVLLPACSPDQEREVEPGRIPDVVELGLPDAKELLAQAGYTNVSTRVVDGSDPEFGLERDWQVVAQSPEEGSSAPSGTRVDLDIARFSFD